MLFRSDRDEVALDADQVARQLLATVLERLGQVQPRLVRLPVRIVLEPGERPVDPRRADLEPIGMVERVLARFLQRIEHIGDAARQVGSIADAKLLMTDRLINATAPLSTEGADEYEAEEND